MSHVVSCDGNVVLLEDLKKLRVVADDRGGDNLGSLPVTDRKLLKLCVELLQLRGVLRLLHEEERLQNSGTLGGSDHVAVLVGQLHELAAGRTALIVNLDGIPDGLVGNLLAGNLLQVSLHVVVLVCTELESELLETVLRMSQEDNLHLVAHGYAVVLAHGAQGIADGRGDDAVQLVHGAV